MSKHRIALLDGDVLVYASGFASDGAARATYKSRNPGDISLEHFNIAEHHEPLNYTLHGTSEMINSLIRHAEADDYRILLSHPVNFREQFYPPYKQNRDPTHKPYWHTEIAEYLLSHHPTWYSEQGDEADDAMGIMQTEFAGDDEVETIIVTNDKDLDMIPGLHFNFSKTRKANGIYHVNEVEGLRHFYTQLLQGDDTDNIPGMFKTLGQKCTVQWKYPLEGMTKESDMRNYVLDVYNGDVEHVTLIGKLLWIKRADGLWYDERTIK